MDRVNATDSKERVELGKMTVPDVAVIVLILLVTTGALLKDKIERLVEGNSVSQVSVFQDGILNTTFKLSEDQDLALRDGKMIIEVRSGRVRVKKSECPRQFCVNTGWIQHPGETIICVPYAALIEIKSSGKPLVDAVVF